MVDAPPKARLRNLGPRLLTAVIVAVICIFPFYFGGLFWAALVALFSGRMMFEWTRMTDAEGTQIGLFIALAGLVVALLYAVQGLPFWAMAALGLFTVLAVLEARNRKSQGWIAFGLPYIIVPAVIIILLRGDEAGFGTRGFTQLIFIILIVVAADVGAYFGGSTLKGPKLAPRLSPNKTWSGVLSGLALASLVAVLTGYAIGLSPAVSLMLAVPIVIISVLGDLLESSVKRKIGVKDTGALLPGHGGLLDRLDSLMAAVVGGALIFMLLGDGWPIA